MKHPLPSIERLKAFESAARHLSFSIAADELCMSKGAVSYQIRKLEEQIGCNLFKRTTRQVFLTEAGQKLLITTQSVFQQLGNTLNTLKRDTEIQDVSVAVTTYVAVRWLSSRVARFNEQYPDVSVELRHSVNADDFKLTDTDLAIRWCHCSGRADVFRALEMPMPLFPVCSPGLLRRAGLAEDSILDTSAMGKAPLNGIPLLSEHRTLDLWQAWYDETDMTLENPQRVIADSNVRVQAAIDGQGFILADHLMQTELDNGLLVAPFKEELQGFGYALMSSPARRMSDNALALKDWLAQSK